MRLEGFDIIHRCLPVLHNQTLSIFEKMYSNRESSLTLLMSNFAQNRVSEFSDRDFCIKKLSKIFFIENSQNYHKWL